MIHARSQPASLVEHLKYMSYSPVFHMLWIWLYNFCSTVCACLYTQRDEFLRCDKAQWVKLDGSCWDGASRMMRSCWPPQPRLFLVIYLHYCLDIRDSSMVSDRRLNLMCFHGNWRLNLWFDESSFTFSWLVIWINDWYCHAVARSSDKIVVIVFFNAK